MSKYLIMIKQACWYLKETLKDIVSFNSKLFIVGYPGSRNFGDALSSSFARKLTKKTIIVDKFSLLQLIKSRPCQNYALIGSIMGHCDSNTIVWGAGCISKSDLPINTPHRICAVRGPLTRQILLENNFECPEVYGDPALLLPYFYRCNIKPKYRLGLIPHYMDANHKVLSQIEKQGAIIIDVNVRYNWKQFVNQVLSCECIVSSSLHGLIVADAYHRKSLWCEFSDKIIGGGFKYDDYYSSINMHHIAPYRIKGDETIDDLINSCDKKSINLNLLALIDSCPFDHIFDFIRLT